MLMAFGQDNELALDLFDLPDALLSLRGLGGLIAEFIDKYLHMGNITLLGGALCTHLLKIVLALLEVRAVIAGVGGNTAVLEGGNVVDTGVHECTVVAYDKDCAIIIRNKAAKPLNAFEIKVVCGLVEQKKIGMAEKKLSKCDTHLPASRKLRTGTIEIFWMKAKA